MLTDSFNRIHDYLRISLTDSCNFRCSYCMPEEEIACLPHTRLMQVEEIVEIARIFVELGVKKIRLTGGEPLVRKEVGEIITQLSQLPVELTLTSNGYLIDKHLATLKKAQIRSLNISLDTLQSDKFQLITKRTHFAKVWENILLLLQEGFHVKVNVVAMKGINEDEIVDFVRLTEKLPLHVRFIEFMPFDGNSWNKDKVFPMQQMLQLVEAEFPIAKLQDARHDTAKKFQVQGFVGTFAFITTMSQPFCGDCNRMRLTADGMMKNCLFGKDELNLLAALRKGEDIKPIIFKSLYLKHAVMGGQFAETYQHTAPEKLENRSMIKIGG